MELLLKTYTHVETFLQFISKHVLEGKDSGSVIMNIQPNPTSFTLGELVVAYSYAPNLTPTDSIQTFEEACEQLAGRYVTKSEDRMESEFLLMVQKDPCWKRLYSSYGMPLLKFLVLKCCVFREVKPGIWLQLNGSPLKIKVQVKGKKRVAGKMPSVVAPSQMPESRSTAVMTVSVYPSTNINTEVLPCGKTKAVKMTSDGLVPYRASHPVSIKTMLHSPTVGMSWPVQHVLSQMEVRQGDPIEHLVYSIITEDVGPGVMQITSTNMALNPLRPLLATFIKNHKSTRYWSVFKSLVKSNGASLNSCVDPKLVAKYVRTVLRKVVPVELLGTEKNRNRLLAVSKQAVLMGQYQVMSLGQVMSGVGVKGVAWLGSISRHSLRLSLLSRVFSWLLIHYALVAVSCVMYVTPQNRRRYQLYFYPKPMWQGMQVEALDKLKQKCLEPLTVPEFEDVNLENNQEEQLEPENTGDHLILRFMPKGNGIRPLMMRPASVPVGKTKKHLMLLHYWVQKNADRVNPRNLTFLHEKWSNLRENCFEPGDKLYYVRLDICDAYGSILHEKMKQVLEQLIEITSQNLPEMALVISRPLRNNPVKVGKSRKVTLLGDGYPEDLLPNCVIGERKVVGYVNVPIIANEIIQNLSATVRFKGQLFQMKRGIPQGANLSSALCDLYYGHMDATVLKEYTGHGDEIFIRAVDDYLFITPCQERAESFLQRMSGGIAEYGCKINVTKTATNLPDPMVNCLRSDAWFSFCGIQLDPSTLHTRGDYSSYSSQDMIHSMRMSRCAKPGLALRNSLRRMPYTLKCGSMLVDPTYNSLERIRRNVWQACLMASLRFHGILLAFPKKCSKGPHQPFRDNPKFLINCILGFGDRLWDMLRGGSWRFGGDYGHPTESSPADCIFGNKCQQVELQCTNVNECLSEDKCHKRTKRRATTDFGLPAKRARMSLQGCCEHLRRDEVLYLTYQAFYEKTLRHGGNYGSHVVHSLKAKVNQVAERLRTDQINDLSHITQELSFEI